MTKVEKPQGGAGDRSLRADAQRNADRLLKAATTVFAEAGVDAPMRDIAARAGVGLGTVYRHFPRRADLIAAVFRRQIDDCAAGAPALAIEHAPFEALARWLQRYAAFIGTKRGLAKALHSGDPAFETLPAHFDARLRPALHGLLDAAIATGAARQDIAPDTLLHAIARLCIAASEHDRSETEAMVMLLTDGLRRVAITGEHRT